MLYRGAAQRSGQGDELPGLPQQVYPVFGVCLGHPAQDEVKPRLPVSVTLKENSYSTDGEDEAIAVYDEEMRTYYANRRPTSRFRDGPTRWPACWPRKGGTCWHFCARRVS